MASLAISTRRTRVAALLVLLLMLAGFVDAAAAQSMGGHGGGGGGRGGAGKNNTQQQHTVTPEQAVQPLEAVFTQLQQLKLDLLLKPEQFEAWSSMQYAMRGCVELEKARARRFTSVSSGTVQPPLIFVEDLADNEQAYAEALADLATKMEKLLGLLDPHQQQTFNDRLQSVVPRESLRDPQ